MSIVAGLAIGVSMLLLTGWLCQAVGTARDRRRFPPPGSLVDVGGHRLHVFACGEGAPAVVFEAGIAATSLNWRRIQTRVATLTQAVAYDRAGFGWSDVSPKRPTAGEACEQLRRALRGAGVSPPYVLVGHSFGGYVVQIFAARYPGDVTGLVLVDSITHEDWEHPTPLQHRALVGGAAFARVGAWVAAVGIVRLALTRLREGSAGFGKTVLGMFGAGATSAVTRVVGEVAKMPADVLPAVQAHWSQGRGFRTMARHFEALPASATEVREALESVASWAFPVAVLSAAGAPPAQLRRHRALADRSPQGRHLVARTGHWVHLDEPGLVEMVIADVVERARAHPDGQVC